MSTEASRKARWRTAMFLGLPLLAFLFLQVDGLFPFIRLSNDLANFVVGALSFLLPFLTATLALVLPRRWLTTIVSITLLSPLLCFSTLGLFFEGLLVDDAFRTGVNPAFERVAEVPMANYSVGIYLNDCGAPCGIGIDLLQERRLLPGILLVRRLPGFDDADSATYKIIGENTLQVDVPAFVDTDPRGPHIAARSKIYHLKRFLYF